MPAGMLRVHNRRDQRHAGHSARFARQYFTDKRTAHRVADHGEWGCFADKAVNDRLQPISHFRQSTGILGQCRRTPKAGQVQIYAANRIIATECFIEHHQRTMVHTHAMHKHDGQSIVIALDGVIRLRLCHTFLSQTGTGCISHNSVYGSFAAETVSNGILGFKGLILLSGNIYFHFEGLVEAQTKSRNGVTTTPSRHFHDLST